MIDNIIIKAVGDTLLKSKEGKLIFGNDICKEIESCDLFIINLETTILNENSDALPIEKSVCFRTKPEQLNSLVKYKDKVVFTLSNNHIFDYGDKGYSETIHHIKKYGFLYAPIDEKFTMFLKGKTINIISIYHGINNSFVSDFTKNNYSLDKEDINILSIHWGAEHITIPSPSQINIAKKFIDKEGDIVLGHHSHVAQGSTLYKEKPIFFSLGNFNMWQFDTKMRIYNKKSFIAKLNIDKKKKINAEKVAIYINEDYLPVLDRKESRKVDFELLDSLIPNIDNINKLKYFIFYHSHNSKPYIKGNIIGGWIPRIKKYGISHFFMMLRWFISKNFIVSLLLLPLNRLNKATRALKKIDNA